MKKKKRVKNSSKKEEPLMKSALEELRIKPTSSVERKKFDFRDIFWNYPEFLISTFKKLIPISYIVLFSIIVVSVISFLKSDTFTKMIVSNQKQDTLIGGVVGSVNSLNPLFVTNSYIERSLDSLIFERFVNIDKNGEPLPGIAKSWEKKEKGLVYEFTIDDGHYWHDGEKLTVDDIIFTFETAIELSKEQGFDSVGVAFADMEVSKVDENTVKFKVSEESPTFFKAISIYIVPEKYLSEVDVSKMAFDSFSKQPIGSGKYEFVKMDSSSVYLVDNEYDRYNPVIKNIVFKIYPDESSLEMAFRADSLDSFGSWDSKWSTYVDEYKNFTRYSKIIEDRQKLILFNTRKESLKNKEVRVALTLLLKKEDLIEEVGVGGEVLNGPLPSSSWAYNKDVDFLKYNPTRAEEILKKLGYEKNENSGYFENSQGEILTFTISYLSTDLNERIVDLLVNYYKKEGVFIKSEALNYEQMTQEIIASRNFELLLYEIETSIDPDQYNLWHSLKVNFPDLNLSGYSYNRVDILLEEGRLSMDKNIRKQKYLLFQKYLMADAPVIFLYSPKYEYVVRDNLIGIDFEQISHSYERFHNIEEWYWE